MILHILGVIGELVVGAVLLCIVVGILFAVWVGRTWGKGT